MKIKVSAFVVGLAAAAALIQPHSAIAQTKSDVVNEHAPDTIKGKSRKYFKDIVDKELAGKINLEISYNDALYDQKNMVQALQLGAVQFISPVVGVYSSTFPKLTVLVLPYLLSSPEAIRAAMDDPEVGGALFDEMRKKGIEPLGVWLNGPRDVGTTAQKPILVPADMKGVTIRVPPGRNYVDTFKSLGANVTTMSWSEVPNALRTGIVDAVEPVPNAWVSAHLYESAKQITRTGYIWDFYIVSTNKAWWDKLDAGTRATIKKALDETTKWNWENTHAENARAFDVMKKAGATIHDLTPQQKAAWVDAVKPLWSSLGNSLVGDKVMARLIEIGEKHR